MRDQYAAPGSHAAAESREGERRTYGEAYRPPGPAGYPSQRPNQPYVPYPDDGRAAAEYGQRPPRPRDGRRAESSSTRVLWILGFVFAAVALLVPLVGLAGIGCGAVAWKRGSRRGRTATVVAVVTTVIAWALGVAYYTM